MGQKVRVIFSKSSSSKTIFLINIWGRISGHLCSFFVPLGQKDNETKESRRNCNHFLPLGALSIQAKIPATSVCTVWPQYSEPALRVVHFDQYGHFGRSDRNVPFHLTKLLFPVSIFCLLFTRTITERAAAWVGSVQSKWTVPLGAWNFWNFKPEFLLNGKRPWITLESINEDNCESRFADTL